MRILIRLPVCSGSPVLIALNCRPSGVTTHLKLIASRSNTSLAGVKVNHKYEHVDCYESTLSRINTKCSVNQVTAVIAGRNCPNQQKMLGPRTGPFGTQVLRAGDLVPLSYPVSVSKALLDPLQAAVSTPSPFRVAHEDQYDFVGSASAQRVLFAPARNNE